MLRLFFGLSVSGQMKPPRINGYRDIGGKDKALRKIGGWGDFSENIPIQFLAAFGMQPTGFSMRL